MIHLDGVQGQDMMGVLMNDFCFLYDLRGMFKCHNIRKYGTADLRSTMKVWNICGENAKRKGLLRVIDHLTKTGACICIEFRV